LRIFLKITKNFLKILIFISKYVIVYLTKTKKGDIMSLSKIAKFCGCSVSTVSKAFHDSPEVSTKTKEKIFDIAQSLGYYNKYYKPTMDYKTIAVLCPDINSPFYCSLLNALQNKIEKKGDLMVISICQFNKTSIHKQLKYFSSTNSVHGMILLDNSDNISIPPKFPFVSFCSSDSFSCDCIMKDDSGIDQAIQYFKNMGHRKIGYIGEIMAGKRRLEFVNAMMKHNLPIDENYIIVSKERNEIAGYYGMDEILSLDSRPTAIFASYDMIALGAIQRIKEYGLSVPDDFSIIGYDNITTLKYISPSLTTIAQPIDAMSDALLELLYQRIKHIAPAEPQRVYISDMLMIRDSVRRLDDTAR